MAGWVPLWSLLSTPIPLFAVLLILLSTLTTLTAVIAAGKPVNIYVTLEEDWQPRTPSAPAHRPAVAGSPER